MVPDSHKDLLEGPIYSILTTINPEGEPENTVIWASWDGEHVLVNTVRDRRKATNVEKNPHVALTAIDPNNPYRWIDVWGVVEDVAPVSRKGKVERIILKIKPENVVAYGG